MYKNVQSKVYNASKIKNEIPRPIANTRRINQFNHPKEISTKIVRPNSASAKTIGIKHENNEHKASMFDDYYSNKLEYNNYNECSNNNNNYLNENQVKKELKDDKSNNKFEKDRENIENNNKNIEINMNKKMQRPLTATSKDLRQKDYLADSKYIISCIQKANHNNKIKKVNSKEKVYHKEFGKTPKYLQNMKIEAEKKREIEKLKKETSKYPKGTRLLSEEERLFTLEKLKQSKNDINQIIEKLPITCDSQAFRNKKEELFKKLDEIENAIETFSKKKVFVKVEGS